ncbi:MFS transporter [Streptomyces luteireticuli]|uniref:MFS transporter n=1 Tax=Streptomyces luteireticuli TaxID=173858 RepID=A0ABP3ICR1_9ACTN
MTSGVARRTAREPLRRNRDYQVWWSGAAVSGTGSCLLATAVPLLVLETTGSAGRAGLVAGAAAVAKLVGSSPAGALADRCHRRALLLTASALQLLAAASVLGAAVRHHVGLAHLVAAAAVEGLGYSLHTATELPLLRRIVPEEQRRSALSREQSRKATAQLAGPPLGGLLFSWSPGAPFAAAALCFLGVTGAALALRTPLGPPVREPAPGDAPRRATPLAGLRHVRASPFLRYMLVWFALVNGAFAGLGLLLVVLCHARGASAAAVGLTQAVGSAGAVLGAWACERLTARTTGARLLRAASWILLAGTVAMAVPLSAPFGGLAYAGALFLTPAVNVSFMEYMVRTVPERLTGRISMTMMTAARSLNWAFTTVVGSMADRWGPLVPLFALAGLFLALACAGHVRESADAAAGAGGF